MILLRSNHRQPSLSEILQHFGIVIVPTSKRCGHLQTHAGGVITDIFRKHGGPHLELVLACILEAKHDHLWSETIGAVSDALLFRPEEPGDAIREVFATMDLLQHRNVAVSLRPWPVRQTLRALVDSELGKLISLGQNEERSINV